jgi:hypothetical protein
VEGLALAKPMKHSNKFVVKSSEPSIAEKATAAIVNIAGKKMCSTSAGGNSATRALTRALDRFGSGFLAWKDETPPPPPEPPRKRPRKFPLPKDVPKPSVMKGNFERLLSLFYCFENCDGEPFHFDTAKIVAAPSTGAAKDLGVRMFVPPSPPHRESHQLKLRPPLLTRLACWTLC